MPPDWFPKVRSSSSFNTYWLCFLNYHNTIFTNAESRNPHSYSYYEGGTLWSMFENNEHAKKFAKAKAIVHWKTDINWMVLI